jgi:hypothetical protein
MRQNKELLYTVQFTEEEFDKLNGSLYIYYRDLKYRLDLLLSEEDKERQLNDEQKEYYINQLNDVLSLVQKLEWINNQADETNPLYILEKQNVT